MARRVLSIEERLERKGLENAKQWAEGEAQKHRDRAQKARDNAVEEDAKAEQVLADFATAAKAKLNAFQAELGTVETVEDDSDIEITEDDFAPVAAQ